MEGRRIAQMEMEIVIAKLIRSYKLEWHAPDLKFKMGITMIPEVPKGDHFKMIDV
jgi:cytochrome P450